ncbi:hypothetical protein NKH71_03335 [Mesorhizobium sp. M0983]|uniref:hypothetical protein n=1 Tax=Mesorhizobium sp. M0983 TaxID=2957040 RepID=UPI0033387E77
MNAITVPFPQGRARKFDRIVAGSLGQGSKVVLQNLRTVTYLEYAVFVQNGEGSVEWWRHLVSNRFHTLNPNLGAPRSLACTLCYLYATTAVAALASNKATGTTGQAAILTQGTSSGTYTGTFVGPTTIVGVPDIKYSSTIGDFVTYTVTGVSRIVFRGAITSNGGIESVLITDNSTGFEIPAGDYLLPSTKLINWAGQSSGLAHIPGANVDPAKTYTVKKTVHASNPAGFRMYQGGLLGYAPIAFDAVGVHGIVDVTSIAGVNAVRSYPSGTVRVERFDNATRIDWQYVTTNASGIAVFKVYNSLGVEIGAYDATQKDTYSTSTVLARMKVASGLPKGTYYLHVTSKTTKNAASTDYRLYDFGGFAVDETQVGNPATDEFDILDMSLSPTSVAQFGNSLGTGTGNLELAIQLRKSTDALGLQEFVGGTHGHESAPTGFTVKVDGVVINYAAATQFQRWSGSIIEITMQSNLLAPSDGSVVANVAWTQTFFGSYYVPSEVITTTAPVKVHVDYGTMLHVPNALAGTQGIGGGYNKVAFDGVGDISGLPGSNLVTPIPGHQRGVCFYNSDYAAMAYPLNEPDWTGFFPGASFQTTRSLWQSWDRNDLSAKVYQRMYGGDETNGVLVPAGTTWSRRKVIRVMKHPDMPALLGLAA